MAKGRPGGVSGWIALALLIFAALLAAWYVLLLALLTMWLLAWMIAYLVVAICLPFTRTEAFRTRLLNIFGPSPFARTGRMWMQGFTFGSWGRRHPGASSSPVAAAPMAPPTSPPASTWAWLAVIAAVLVAVTLTVVLASAGAPRGERLRSTAKRNVRVQQHAPVTGSPPSPSPKTPGPPRRSPAADRNRHVAGRPPPRRLPSRPPAPSCPSRALLGVYHPYRLRVLGACRWFRGTVTGARHEEDGDYHVDVAPDRGYARFLDAGNYSRQLGSLVTEIMPGQRLPLPSFGEHVAVLGTWVADTQHGWNEIHPIWAIRYGNGRTIRSLPPSTPRYGSSPPGGGPSEPGGSSSRCTLGYSPCLPLGPSDYDCYGGGGDGPAFTRPGVAYRVTGPDPYRLDSDGDGRACE